VDVAIVHARIEALLVEQVDDLLDRGGVVWRPRQRVPREEVAAPGLAGLLCSGGAVVRGCQRAGEDSRQQPMLAVPCSAGWGSNE
jgi:hypothetical protein